MVPLFFVPAGQVSPTGEVQILDRDAWHISRVLRSRQGELVTVVVEDGTEHDVRLETLSADQVTGVIVATRRTRREAKAQLHLLQALPKGPGMASVCEQVSELGILTIWPVLTDRTVARPEPDQAALRAERWQTIAREAAQLAGRHRIPEVRPLAPLLDALQDLRRTEPQLQAFTCHDGEVRQGLNSVAWDSGLPTAVLIGPEGGFTAGEVQELASHGARPVSLGRRNLRTTLAAVVALTVLLARAGDLEAPGG
jgi:16S rRNA (uracil1498-N3)-methyltransferase